MGIEGTAALWLDVEMLNISVYFRGGFQPKSINSVWILSWLSLQWADWLSPHFPVGYSQPALPQRHWVSPGPWSCCPAQSWLLSLSVYGHLSFLSSSLENVPLFLEAFWRRTKRKGNGVCRNAKIKNPCSDAHQSDRVWVWAVWLKTTETHFGKLQQ